MDSAVNSWPCSFLIFARADDDSHDALAVAGYQRQFFDKARRRSDLVQNQVLKASRPVHIPE